MMGRSNRGGGATAAGIDDALGHLDLVDNRLFLAYTSPPEGWSPLQDDPTLELPDLTFIDRIVPASWPGR